RRVVSHLQRRAGGAPPCAPPAAPGPAGEGGAHGPAPPPRPPPPPPRPSGPRVVRHGAVTRLSLGKIGLLLLVAGLGLVGLLVWLFTTQARPAVQAVESTLMPAWTRQGLHYAPDTPLRPTQAAAAVDPTAGLNAKLAALQAELAKQALELEALKKRPSGGTTIVQPGQQAPTMKATPPAKQSSPMLFVEHQVKEPEAAASKVPEYTLVPGATKLPCVVETVVNSDVPGYLTAKVSTNVYDTATGRHLLVPQGSTILGHDRSQDLLYGNARLDTVSLTLAFPDGRSIDLGKAPITDQAGVAGLTGDVNQHYLRLLGAVFIGGALRGGMQAMQTSIASAGGVEQVAVGMGSLGNQAVGQRVGRALDTRPTILVAAGQLCNVLLVKEVRLPALWQ